MKVITIIVTYNGMKWIDRCITSVLESTIRTDIYVIDNCSTDNIVEYLNNNYPQVIIYESKENLGFGKANNIGLKYALDKNYDFVYLLNQDAWIEPETIKKLIEIIQLNPNYGILSPLQCNSDKLCLDSNFNLYACSDEMRSDAILNKLKVLYPTEFVMAAHWLISKACLTKVGGFSPTFPHYGEDNNYIQRCYYHGFKIGIVTDSRGVHDRGTRKHTKEFSEYRSFIKELVKISDPKIRIGYLYLLKLSAKSILGLTPLTYKYLVKILLSMRRINKNKTISKSVETAFI